MENMSNLRAVKKVRSSHFVASDFCVVFDRDMQILYSLALLLTGEQKIAEQCFVLALQQCLEGPDVVSGWERRWSRRAIVKQAIALVRPKSDDSEMAVTAVRADSQGLPSQLLKFRPFDRFVFAMTVLERYTIRETAALLNTVPSAVEKARIRVFEGIGPQSTDWHPKALGRAACEAADFSAIA